MLNTLSSPQKASTDWRFRLLIVAIATVGCCCLRKCPQVHAQASTDSRTALQIEDAWYVIRFDGQPAGYERVRTVVSPPDEAASGNRSQAEFAPIGRQRSADDSQPETVDRIRDTHIQLKRFGRELSITAVLRTTETQNGQLKRFELRRHDGEGDSIERTGSWDDHLQAFSIEEKVQASRRRYSLGAPQDVRSPIMSEWIPGSVDPTGRREAWPVLFPETAAVADISARLKGQRRIELANGRTQVVDVIDFYPSDNGSQKTTLYVDGDNTVYLQEKRVLGGQLTLERTTADDALSAVRGKSLDLDVAGIIPLNRVPNLSAGREQLILDLDTSEVPGFLVPAGRFQKVQQIDDSTQRITLLKPVRDSGVYGGTGRVVRKPITPTRWMPTNNLVVQRLAKGGAVGETDAMLICLRLERYLNSEIRRSPFSTTLIPADQVAEQLRGDCTEHAMLLATLIRVHGIRSRVVSGLVMLQQGIGFTGHTWVEASINNEWIPFDSTIRSTELGLTHIRLADSELPDSVTSGVELFIPVLDLAGRASLSLVQSR